jgi:type VI secretion system protein ImpB
MEKQAPRLAFRVDNTLNSKGGKLGVELRFKKLSDFEPQNVARQVEPLKELLELRTKLASLSSSLFGNDKLEEALRDAMKKIESTRKGTGEAATAAQSEDQRG